jgi:hypothetical protein
MSMTSPGISGFRYRNSSPLDRIAAALSYQNSTDSSEPQSSPWPTRFFTLNVVTISVPSAWYRLGHVDFASPRIGGTILRGAAGAAWGGGVAGLACPASALVANSNGSTQPAANGLISFS